MTSRTGEQRPARTYVTIEPRLLPEQRRRIYIGEIVASATPLLLQTLLGSCVAVCLRDPVACIGGMNHILLPGRCDGDDRPSRCGVHAMELLINAIMNEGGDRRRLVAKVFGAGNVVASSAIADDRGTECSLCPRLSCHGEDCVGCPASGRYSSGPGQFQDGYRQDDCSHRRRLPAAHDPERGGRLPLQLRQNGFGRGGQLYSEGPGRYICVTVEDAYCRSLVSSSTGADANTRLGPELG